MERHLPGRPLDATPGRVSGVFCHQQRALHYPHGVTDPTGHRASIFSLACRPVCVPELWTSCPSNSSSSAPGTTFCSARRGCPAADLAAEETSEKFQGRSLQREGLQPSSKPSKKARPSLKDKQSIIYATSLNSSPEYLGRKQFMPILGAKKKRNKSEYAH